MQRYRFDVRLVLQGPWVSQGSGARKFGVDTAALREGGLPSIPGSLIAGNLRHAWEYFAGHYQGVAGVITRSEIGEWLGEASSDADWQPRRGRLIPCDRWLPEKAGGSDTKTRVQENERTGAVQRGALQVIEMPYASGETITLRGGFDGHFPAEREAQRVEQWIDKGFRFIPALAAFKGIGFGRLMDVQVQVESYPPAAATAEINPVISADAAGFSIQLEFDRPICFARHRNGMTGGNRFESETHVPGGAIKAALARAMGAGPDGVGALKGCAWPRLQQHFESVRVTHCLPTNADAGMARPVSIPLSLVAADGDELWDVATRGGQGLIRGRAPAFQPDWKGAQWLAAAKLCGWPKLLRRLDIHNGIDPAVGRTRKEALFSIEAIQPEGLSWIGTVHVDDIQEPAERAETTRELVGLLEHGLEQMGKTGARARVKVGVLPEASPAIASRGLLVEGQAIITLQAAARLLPDFWNIPPTNGGAALKNAYATSWNELSRGQLNLERFHARQILHGGRYMWRRFRPREPYNPELLTAPGSVFVLTATRDEEEASKVVEGWLNRGLPTPSGTAGGDDWQQTPLLASNGFGEVLVNLETHWAKRPADGDWHALSD